MRRRRPNQRVLRERPRRNGNEIISHQDRQGWGEKVIDQLAKNLRHDFPDMTGLSPTNIKYMRRFAETWPQNAIGQQMVDQLPWDHTIQIMVRLPDQKTREWHINRPSKTAGPGLC
jgi:predicted nuclease of restriction endonuclease-like (RecB) superfamily